MISIFCPLMVVYPLISSVYSVVRFWFVKFSLVSGLVCAVIAESSAYLWVFLLHSYQRRLYGK